MSKRGDVELVCDILSRGRRDLLPKLKFLKNSGFYLAGGTALALQIGHRISVDFDFYNQNNFSPNKIYQVFQAQKPSKILLGNTAENTLILEINDIAISLFTYDYPLLKPLITSENLNIASLEDIAAMKLVAIIQRGVKRDFIDLYFLTQIFGLEKIMSLTKKKYAGFNKYLACQALVYFKDAQGDRAEEVALTKPVTWEKVKKYLEAEVGQVKRKWSKHE
jgi:hypothetical protein